MACSLQGLIRFQSTWHDIADAMGLVSERVRSSDPEYASMTRNKTLADALPEIEMSAEKLKSLIRDIRNFTGAGSLDVSHGSMASRTAEGFYKTLGAEYLSHYFDHMGKEDLLGQVKVKTLGTRFIEGFFGHITANIPGNNPTFLEFSKRVATEAFHFIVPVVTSGFGHSQNVSIRRTRDEVSSTYTYTAENHDSNNNSSTCSSEAMWAMFQQRHDEYCFTTEDFRKSRRM